MCSRRSETDPATLPVIGPIVGGWIVQTRLGWRFNFWLMFIFSALSLTFGVIVMSETVSRGAWRSAVSLMVPGLVCPCPPPKTGTKASDGMWRPVPLHLHVRCRAA